MLRAFRFLAFALMALLPLQGMASVVAGQCMAFGHHQDAGAQDHQDANAHDHGHAATGGHDQDSHKHPGGEKKSHCGPCTACCASASISGPSWPLILPARSDSQYLFAQFLPLGVQPDGLFRPPLPL